MWTFISFLFGFYLSGDLILECIATNDGFKTKSPCASRKYQYDSVVCVCNATYCDDIGNIPDPPNNKYLHFVSSVHGDRLKLSIRDFTVFGPLFLALVSPFIVVYQIYPYLTHQEIKGFGGAMPDSTGINIATLSKPVQEKLMRQYFGDDGINYSFIRVPIGGTDFSTRYYTLDDTVNDTTLEHFSLSEEDFLYKSPYLKQAIKLSKQEIKLIAASWTAPLWMKKPRVANKGRSALKKEYHQLYADYHIRFFEEYEKQGLHFWGLSPQNEPLDGYYYYLGFNSMGWSPKEIGDWIGNHLGPTLKEKGYGHLEIIILDDQRLFLPFFATLVMQTKARQFVSGIGVHSYTDHLSLAPAALLTATKMRFPDLYILNTETSIMHFKGAPAAPLGLWDHAEYYASMIIQDINNWSTGWIDWNLALDLEGGPNWADNTVDSPIIVNATADEFYKQPMFYALAHFSKFIPPGSIRITMETPNSKGIKSTSFVTPENNIVIILLNKLDTDKYISITAGLLGNIQMWTKAHSIHTIIYKNTMF